MRAKVNRPSYGTFGSTAIPKPPFRHRPRWASALGTNTVTAKMTEFRIQNTEFSKLRRMWYLNSAFCILNSVIFAVISVRQGIHEVIHPQLVCLIRQLDRHEASVRPLPVIANVVVVVHDHHQPLRRIVVLEDPVELRGVAEV